MKMRKTQNYQQEILVSEPTEQLKNPSQHRSIKTQEYESKIYELANQVKLLRDRLVQMQVQKSSLQGKYSEESERDINRNRVNIKGQNERSLGENEKKLIQLEKYVKLLKVDNDELRKQNLILKDRVKSLEKLIYRNNQNRPIKKQIKGQDLASVKSMKQMRNQYKTNIKTGQSQLEMFSPPKQSIHSSTRTNLTTNLIRQLLVQCNQPFQFQKNQNQGKVLKDQFYEFKDTKDCFEPFYSSLSREAKLRLRKCLLKQRQLLYVDQYLQIGTIAPYKGIIDTHQFNMILVITCVSILPITNLSIQYIHQNDISIKRKKSKPGQQIFSKPIISSNQQIKQQLNIIVNNVDFACVKFNLQYQVNRQSINILGILPISKIKLIKGETFTAMPKEMQNIQRVIEFEPKLLGDFQKLNNYFAYIYENRDKFGKIRYSTRLNFLNKIFFVQLTQIDGKLDICIYHKQQRVIGEKIMGEFVFLFQK